MKMPPALIHANRETMRLFSINTPVMVCHNPDRSEMNEAEVDFGHVIGYGYNSLNELYLKIQLVDSWSNNMSMNGVILELHPQNKITTVERI